MGGAPPPPPFAENSAKIINLIFATFPYPPGVAVPFLLEIQEEAQQEVEASQEDDELQHNYANLKRNGIIKYLADVDDDLPGDAGAGLGVGVTTLAFISKPIHSGHALELGTHWNWTRTGTGHAFL